MVFSIIQKRIVLTTFILCCCGLFFLPNMVGAAGLINTSGCEVPGADLGNCRNIEILLVQAISLIEYLFGIIGTLAFAMFIYGGLKMILAFGSEDKFKEGKEAMVNAVIGMIIAFSAYILVNFVLDVLGVTKDFRAVGNNGGVPSQVAPTNTGDACTQNSDCDAGSNKQSICQEGKCMSVCSMKYGGSCGNYTSANCNASSTLPRYIQNGVCPGDASWVCCAPITQTSSP